MFWVLCYFWQVEMAANFKIGSHEIFVVHLLGISNFCTELHYATVSDSVSTVSESVLLRQSKILFQLAFQAFTQ